MIYLSAAVTEAPAAALCFVTGAAAPVHRAGTGDPCNTCERNTGITSCPRVKGRLQGSWDLGCKYITEINTGNTFPAGLQSEYLGPVPLCVIDTKIP